MNSAEADELEALRLENERLRLRAEQIGAKVPGTASLRCHTCPALYFVLTLKLACR